MPVEVEPPSVPFTFQVTLVLLLPVTVAVNCTVWPWFSEELVGERETVMVVEVELLLLPPQPAHNNTHTTTMATVTFFKRSPLSR